MPAVSDSSPLILFAAIGRFELLHTLYGEIIVPEAVWRETTVAGVGLPGAAETSAAPWVQRRSVPEEAMANLSLASLDRGEAEAIALAISFSPRLLILLDDRRARRIAVAAGLAVTGTGGAVVEAKLQVLVRSVRPLFAALQTAGLYLPETAIDSLLALADER